MKRKEALCRTTICLEPALCSRCGLEDAQPRSAPGAVVCGGNELYFQSRALHEELHFRGCFLAKWKCPGISCLDPGYLAACAVARCCGGGTALRPSPRVPTPSTYGAYPLMPSELTVCGIDCVTLGLPVLWHGVGVPCRQRQLPLFVSQHTFVARVGRNLGRFL